MSNQYSESMTQLGHASTVYGIDERRDHIHRAQVHATLALAYEQRTANLIAFLAWEPTREATDADVQLQKQIVERLGLGE